MFVVCNFIHYSQTREIDSTFLQNQYPVSTKYGIVFEMIINVLILFEKWVWKFSTYFIFKQDPWALDTIFDTFFLLCRIETLCHDINVHIPHHISSRIPSYNLRAAHQSLRDNWGKVCFILYGFFLIISMGCTICSFVLVLFEARTQHSNDHFRLSIHACTTHAGEY